MCRIYVPIKNSFKIQSIHTVMYTDPLFANLKHKLKWYRKKQVHISKEITLFHAWLSCYSVLFWNEKWWKIITQRFKKLWKIKDAYFSCINVFCVNKQKLCIRHCDDLYDLLHIDNIQWTKKAVNQTTELKGLPHIEYIFFKIKNIALCSTFLDTYSPDYLLVKEITKNFKNLWSIQVNKNIFGHNRYMMSCKIGHLKYTWIAFENV